MTIFAKDKKPSAVAIEKEPITNEKVKGANVAEKEATRKKAEPYCREVARTQQDWFNHQLPYVRTNVKFEFASTQPPELRCAVQRQKNNCISKVVDEDGTLKPVAARTSFHLVFETSFHLVVNLQKNRR